jgi:hypothetical protein
MADTPTNTQTQTIDYDALAQQAVSSSASKSSSPKSEWVPKRGDPVAHVQTSDGAEYHIHGDDLAKLQKIDPGHTVIAPPTPYKPDYDALAKQAGAIQPPAPLSREQARSRTLQNMTSAMSGQPMQNPEDQAEAERGRRDGTIAGGLQIAAGVAGPAAGALFAPGVQVAQETSSILGPEGQPIVKEVLKKAPSVAAKTASTVVDTAQTIAKWTKENPIKAVAVEALAHEMGIDPFQLLGKVIKYGKNLF